MNRLRCLAVFASLAVLAAPVHAQCSVSKLVDPNGKATMHFGDRFALNGDELFVGSVGADTPFGPYSGGLFRWVRTGGAWSIAEFLYTDHNTNGKNFGYGVAATGDHLLVGSYSDGDAGTIAGAVYAFERGSSGFTQIQKLIPSTAAAFSYTGFAVAADRDWVVIGGTDIVNLTVGKAWVFRFVTGAWVEKQELAPSDGVLARRFGQALDIDDDRLVVCAPAWGPTGQIWVGSAYVYEFVAGAWTETAHIVAPDGLPFDDFGQSVALDGDRILFSATGDDENGVQSGSVYVYDLVGGVWQQSTKLVSNDAQQGDYFGASVDLQGDVAAVGAALDDDLGVGAGAGYLFVKGASGWKQTQRFTAPDPQPDHQFGHWVQLDGGTVVFSAYRDATWGVQSGADYVFDIGGEATNTCISEPNSTGVAADITYTGTLSTSAGTFALHAQNLPPNKYGVFFYGPNPGQLPFGNGWLCTLAGSTGIFRLNPPTKADTNGHLARTIDFGVAPAGAGAGTITPGSTWYFQCWYRDPTVGAGYDLTDGLRVVFCP
ncbi:MAG: FG-GAP repeat protein [Planctomycetes bacterium]|nr:FG-GAP repeat protein [Planctomycetota bacterium]